MRYCNILDMLNLLNSMYFVPSYEIFLQIFSNLPKSGLNIKHLILSEDWNPVIDFFTFEKLQWLFFFILSPIWLTIKSIVTILYRIHGVTKDWPWFLIKFAIFELVLVTTDIGSDLVQGIRLSLDDDPFWGSFTLAFILFPMLGSLLIHCFKKLLSIEEDPSSSSVMKFMVSIYSVNY